MEGSEGDMFGSLFEEPESPGPVQGCAPKPQEKVDGVVEAPPPGRGETAFCGIKNQGATCYLNSLIQTLLLTPELRTALFQLGPEELGHLEDIKNPNCRVRKIPVQLQMLLARLLLLNQYACGTEDLTDSFGWVDSETLQQHDVQELSRILFCAIEDSLVGTSGHDVIKKLYRGTSANTIKCLCCGKVSERLEDFLDLNIAIATKNSLTSVLHEMFVETELMNGKNQYRCENCEKLVDARKGAVVKTLPPILTFSLLRFSFDYETLRRYKETRKFQFPMSLNMRPYCKGELPGDCGDQKQTECYDYELYSVIIHSGSAHGGHYHAYIRDVDGLGTVPPDYDPNPTASVNSSPVKSDMMNSYVEDPVEMLACVLAKLGGKSVPLNRLGEVFREESGTSWAKQYRRKYGTMIKFLQNHLDTFAVDQRTKTVSFRTTNSFSSDKFPNSNLTHTADGSGDCWNSGTFSKEKNAEKLPNDTSLMNGEPNGFQNANVENDSSLNDSTGSDCHPLSNIWFDFNDSHVKPIVINDIKQQFEGRESAYMLFYRRRDLKRPMESLGNSLYGIPVHIREMIERENRNLEDLRTEYSFKLNVVSVHVFYPSMFVKTNGLIEIADGANKRLPDCGTPYTIDRRETIGEMLSQLRKMYQKDKNEKSDATPVEQWQCHVVKELPHGGIHVYEHVNHDTSISIDDSILENGMNLLVWNGKTLKDLEIIPGDTNEPIVLNVECQIANSDFLHSIDFQGTTFCNVTLGDLRDFFLQKLSLENVSKSKLGKRWSKTDVKYFEDSEFDQTLGEQKVRYVENFVLQIELKVNEGTDNKETSEAPFLIDISPGEELREEEDIFSTSNKVFNMTRLASRAKVYPSMKVQDLKFLISRSLFREIDDNFVLHVYLDRHEAVGFSKLPLHGERMLSDAGVTEVQNSVKLEVGPPPNDLEYHVYLYIQKGNKLKLPLKKNQGTQEILDKTCTVEQCVDSFISSRNLSKDLWHLRHIKSDRELGDFITQVELSVEKSGIQHGCSIILCPGGIPSEGRLRIPVWYYPRNLPLANTYEVVSNSESSSSPLSLWKAFLEINEFEPVPVCHVEIEKDATLFDLKCEIIKHNFFIGKNFNSSEEVCLRSVSQKLPTRFHLQDNSSVKRLRLGPGTPIAVQAMNAVPSKNFVSLRVDFHTPGTRDFVNPSELMWDSTRPVSQLPVELAEIIQLPLKDILIAKQCMEGWEWEVIKSKEPDSKTSGAKSKTSVKKGPKQKKGQGKPKGKKSGGAKSSSQDPSGGLKDGDVIRVKCISKEEEAEGGPHLTDFKSEDDLAAIKRSQDSKAKESNTAQEQPKDNQHTDNQICSPSTDDKKKNSKHKKEETLRIHVDKF